MATALMALPIALVAGIVALTARTGNTESTWTLLPSTAAIALVGALLAGLRPRYAGGWLLLVTGATFLLGQIANLWAYAGIAAEGTPTGTAAWALWVDNWIYPPALVPFFVLLPLTFPDGRLPSPRWRPVAVVAVALAGLLVLLGAFGTPTLILGSGRWPNPFALDALLDVAPTADLLAQLATLAAGIVATGSLVVRWRTADHSMRRQILWVVLALGAVCGAFAVDAAVALLAPEVYPLVFPVIQLMPIVVPVAVAVAVLRHQLFDVELLVSRALVYALLTATLVLLYAAAAAAAGLAWPGGGDAGGRLLAAALVAVAFAPLREWLQRRVGRRLFGDRAEPYAAFLRLSRKLEGTSSPDGVVATLATSVAEALKSPYAAVHLSEDGTLGPGAEHGRRPRDGTGLVQVELTHGGERVGRLVVGQRGREPFSAADLRLLSDLALPIGAALHAVRLSIDLHGSRERLVLSVEEERRRLGRELHDSLGPSLAAISMQVETAAGLVHSDPDRAAGMLSDLLDQTEQAVRETRALAHTHRPPALDALGLVAALEAHVSHLTSVPVTLTVPDPLPDLPAAVEIAAYRIALEALNNVIVHADARNCGLTITHDGRHLVVEVEDDGRGSPDDHRVGLGRDSMRERAEELGGTLTVLPGPSGRGTLVRAVLPCVHGVPPTGDHARPDSHPGRTRPRGLPWPA
jgi:signal transduction histidine kinase